MSVRRDLDAGDSLELLLDTICNAFGGILFLTILLTILLRLSHPKTETKAVSEPARHELTALATELDTVLAELETLERSLDIQAKTRERLVDADLENRYRDLEKLREQRQALERLTLERNREAAQTQQKTDSITAASLALDQKLDQVKGDLEVTTEKLDAERKQRTQSVVPPHSHSSRKRELALSIRYSRVYQDRRWDQAQLTSKPNLDDFVALGEKDGFLCLTPKPYKGLPIEDNGAFADDLKSLLASHPADDWHICLAVWADSFEKFLTLKKRLIDWGYEIRLLAIAEGGATFEGHVPDPQVQQAPQESLAVRQDSPEKQHYEGAVVPTLRPTRPRADATRNGSFSLSALWPAFLRFTTAIATTPPT